MTPQQLQRLPAELRDVIRTARNLENATAPTVIPLSEGKTIRALRRAHRENIAAAAAAWGPRSSEGHAR